jgi:hypothetical protein
MTKLGNQTVMVKWRNIEMKEVAREWHLNEENSNEIIMKKLSVSVIEMAWQYSIVPKRWNQ